MEMMNRRKRLDAAITIPMDLELKKKIDLLRREHHVNTMEWFRKMLKKEVESALERLEQGKHHA